MKKYTVGIVGCGTRGRNHLQGFLANADRFEVVAICDLDTEKLKSRAKEFSIEKTYTDAEEMLAIEKPDVFCFSTHPTIRLPLVELGVKYGVKLISFEKPMARSLSEAKKINELCSEAGIKYVVSHQHIYAPHWKKAKKIIDTGEIGEIHTIHATSKANLLVLGCHLVDYALWCNHGSHAEWVIGHVDGKKGLSGSHSSPDMAFGKVKFENGVHAVFEFGTLAPDYPKYSNICLASPVTIYGSHGYVKVLVDGYLQAFTKSSHGQVLKEQGDDWVALEKYLQIPYIRDIAEWLDDPRKVHPCNGDISYRGFQILMGICLSGYENRRIDLPIEQIPTEPILETLKRELPN